MFCLQNNKGVFFTKGTTEDVLMHVSCHLVLAVNKTNCCPIRVTLLNATAPGIVPKGSSVEHVLDEILYSLSFLSLLTNLCLVMSVDFIYLYIYFFLS